MLESFVKAPEPYRISNNPFLAGKFKVLKCIGRIRRVVNLARNFEQRNSEMWEMDLEDLKLTPVNEYHITCSP